MIIKNTVHFKYSRLFVVESVLDAVLANKLQTLFDLANPDWSTDVFATTPGRMQNISQVPIVIETETYARDTLALLVSKALDKPVKFIGSSFWWDFEGYKLEKHFDLPGINYVLQLYIDAFGSESVTLGTSFYNSAMDLVAKVPYKHNTGYLLENPWAVLHGLDVVVPSGHQRKSVYLRFADI